jgi:hypothetical protein
VVSSESMHLLFLHFKSNWKKSDKNYQVMSNREDRGDLAPLLFEVYPSPFLEMTKFRGMLTFYS